MLKKAPISEHGDDFTCVALTTTSAMKIAEITKYTGSAEEVLGSDEGPLRSPFIGWDVPRIYQFYKSHIRDSEDDNTSLGWTHYTFVIVDEQTLEDETVLLCYDGPDYGETGDEVVLKAARVPITNLATTLQTIETLVGILSEHVGGYDMVLSTQPPASLEHIDGDPPGLFRIAAPKVARANKRSALMQAEREGFTSKEKIDFAISLRVKGAN